MRDIKTKYLKTAMHNVASRISPIYVLHVSFVNTCRGGYYWLWVTHAGDHNTVEWQLEFFEGCANKIKLPAVLTGE